MEIEEREARRRSSKKGRSPPALRSATRCSTPRPAEYIDSIVTEIGLISPYAAYEVIVKELGQESIFEAKRGMSMEYSDKYLHLGETVDPDAYVICKYKIITDLDIRQAAAAIATEQSTGTWTGVSTLNEEIFERYHGRVTDIRGNVAHDRLSGGRLQPGHRGRAADPERHLPGTCSAWRR